jgi:glycosyltransferase involved in cell wall biosynthesis
MNDVAISVIVPAYNSASTIARALDSVFAQTCQDFEVIVVDDGSRDDLTGALAPYGDRVRLIRQPNAGASAARNKGAKHARGRYIAFLDADDFWHTRKLELQLESFRQFPDITYSWTATRRWRDGMPDPSRDPVDPVLGKTLYETDFAALFADPYLGTPGVMICRDVFEKLGGFREDLHSAEDIDLWLRAGYGRAVGHILAPLFFVVAQPDSLTARMSERTYRDNDRVIDDFCTAHPDFARQEARAVRRARSIVLENWGSSVYLIGEYRRARGLLWRALRHRVTQRALWLLIKSTARGITAGG